MDENLFTMSLCSSFAIYANFLQIMYHVFVRLISQRHGLHLCCYMVFNHHNSAYRNTQKTGPLSPDHPFALICLSRD